MPQQFPLLFSPLKIGPVTIRNRIVNPPHGVQVSPGTGYSLEREVDYFIEKAKGGVGMIVKSNYVRPRSWSHLGSWGGLLPLTPEGNLGTCTEDDLIPTYKKLAAEVHRYGTIILSQLNAEGRQGGGWGGGPYRLPVWAPSPLPCPVAGETPKEMEIEDIQEFIEAYAHGARNMQEADFDGVELFAAQGYLLSEFLSPHVNKRTDQYGGSLDNRLRIIVESLEAIRKTTGNDFVVGVRMNCDDFAPDGLTLEMAKEIAAKLAATGMVDYLNISGMTYMLFPGWIADETYAPGMFAPFAAAIREVAGDLPICVVSRIIDPAQAEKILADGQADMVGMCRALIADPELPNKAREGRVDDIRLCISCNQGCLMRLFQLRGVSCIQNPAVTHEKELGIGTYKPAAARKKVVVVGGGPAGMASARVAAERGHNVVLYEKERELGGQNNMHAMVSSQHSFGEVTRWQARQLHKMGVNIKLNTEAGTDTVMSENPDTVVVATGSTPLRAGYTSHRPDIMKLPGSEQDNVLTIWDVFRNCDKVKKNVLLIDDDSYLTGLETAEYLADLGKTVQIITAQIHAGRDIPPLFLSSIYRRVLPKGIIITANSLVKEIRGDNVLYYNLYTKEERAIEGVDTVVLAMGNKANKELYLALKGKVKELYCIGDCLAPRKLENAIFDGERIGRMI